MPFELIEVNQRIESIGKLSRVLSKHQRFFSNRSVVIELMIAVNKRRLPLGRGTSVRHTVEVDQLSSTGSRESAVASGKRLPRSSPILATIPPLLDFSSF